MSRRICLLFVAAVVGTVAAALPSVAAAKTAAPHYYLALGDSLSQGMQPNLSGATVNTNQGYANDLLKIERKHVHNLKLVQLGCGGDTTTSMLTGKGNDAAAKLLHCDRKGGSQEAAAVRFLKQHHKGEVPLVTVDIGANDVDGCASVPATEVLTCVNEGLASIKSNLPKILAGLKKAAPKGTTFAAMTIYDPVLGGYLSPAGTATHTLAAASVGLVQAVNDALTQADTKAGFLTADVAGAFDTYNTTDTASWQGQQLPINVAQVCNWTWACQAPPRGPNIHANKTGYQVIANAFAKVIGKRVH